MLSILNMIAIVIYMLLVGGGEIDMCVCVCNFVFVFIIRCQSVLHLVNDSLYVCSANLFFTSV
jgi:hypothetical protein